MPINLSLLDSAFENGATVTPAVLTQIGLVDKRAGRLPAIKILGTGTLTKKLSVSKCVTSDAAKKAIEAAGGSVL